MAFAGNNQLSTMLRNTGVLNLDLQDLFPTFNFGRVRGFSSKAVTSVLMKSLAECARVLVEDGDIVIRIGPVIAPRARAVKHYPLEPVAVDFAERRARAGQDGVCLWIVGDCFLTACTIQGTGEERGRRRHRARMAYFLQQFINGLTLGSIYGLIAIGYTMVYGIIGMINFAHGEIYMIGAFISIIAFLVLVALGITYVPLALALVLLTTMFFTSIYGWAVGRVAYRPLRGSFRLAPLISAIGMSIF